PVAAVTKPKSFAQALSNVEEDISISQLPIPSVRGDKVSVTITQTDWDQFGKTCHLGNSFLWARVSLSFALAKLMIREEFGLSAPST
ncbi:hypothetical protein A2U01_0046426, partial [Trifolium medium]|nr:hypothetical protein [Trifolium medium]